MIGSSQSGAAARRPRVRLPAEGSERQHHDPVRKALKLLRVRRATSASMRGRDLTVAMRPLRGAYVKFERQIHSRIRNTRAGPQPSRRGCRAHRGEAPRGGPPHRQDLPARMIGGQILTAVTASYIACGKKQLQDTPKSGRGRHPRA